MAAAAEKAAGPLSPSLAKKGKEKSAHAQQQQTKRQQEKEARAVAAAVAEREEWSARLQSVREAVVAALGKQLIASHLSRWDGVPPPPVGPSGLTR
jgi:hypothetical protein